MIGVSGRERLSCKKRQVLYHFRTRGSDPRVGPARRRHGKDPPASNCKFEKGESAGQIHGRIIKPLDPTQPDP